MAFDIADPPMLASEGHPSDPGRLEHAAHTGAEAAGNAPDSTDPSCSNGTCFICCKSKREPPPFPSGRGASGGGHTAVERAPACEEPGVGSLPALTSVEDRVGKRCDAIETQLAQCVRIQPASGSCLSLQLSSCLLLRARPTAAPGSKRRTRMAQPSLKESGDLRAFGWVVWIV